MRSQEPETIEANTPEMKRVAILTTLALLIAFAPAQVHAAPQRCSKEDVRALVASFVHLYNKGRHKTLDQLYADEPDFLAYAAAPERTWDEIEDRSTLSTYFRKRHRLNDRLSLKVFWVQEDRETDGSFDFYAEVARTSDQRIARGYYPVKGNAHVADGEDSCRLRLWNMAPLWYQRCGTFYARYLVKEFVAAYNEGNSGALNHILADQSEFETYTDYRAVAGLVPFTAPRHARSVVPGFLDSRHRMHEQIKLVDYQLGRKVRWGWGFGFTIRKTADDIVLPGGIEQTGKGAITNDCKIFVWNAGS